MALAVTTAGTRFTIARLIALTLSVLARRFWLFAPIAVLTCTPMYLYFTYWGPAESAVYVSALRGMSFLRFVQLSLPVVSVLFVTSLALSAILTIPVLRQLGFRRPASRSGRNVAGTLANLLVTMLLFTLINWVAYIFFALPSFILIVFLWVAIPVVVIEGAPSIAAFKRSATLVKGHFWAGLVVIGGLSLADFLCRRVIYDLNRFEIMGRTTAIVASWAVITGFFLASSVLDIVAYRLLRREKEGLTTGDIGDVFD
jgi:hypothetical protein